MGTKQQTDTNWTAEKLLELGRSYQSAAVFVAAAELNLFSALRGHPVDAKSLAEKLKCDLRGLTTLLDALAALQLITKKEDLYSLPNGAEEFLVPESPRSLLAMTQHQANCLRNWAQLAMVVKTGKPADKFPSVRGPEGDAESFIGAMHNISAPMADGVIQSVQPLQFKQLLDIGGASGTWTMAFLRAWPAGKATIFDLPHVIPMAQGRIQQAGFRERVSFASGDFMADPLPRGADLAWVSAIIHQNSRAQNRQLFANVFQALVPGGRVAIRDFVMQENHVEPGPGALFAINMLVATPGGSTFTFEEIREDLASAGFTNAALARQDGTMNAIVVASKEQSK